MSFVKCRALVLALLLVPAPAVYGQTSAAGKASRWATFHEGGEQLYALSLLADAGTNFPRPSGYEVVVLFDTSASQTGWVRQEGLEVLAELAATLPVGSRVALMACDVEAVDLSAGLVAPSDPAWQAAVDRLKQRVPLGTTNLSGALRSATEQFSNSASVQRTIVYIGDGINRIQFLSPEEHRQLINDLANLRITVSSFLIGPAVDVATMAILSNHTGGVLYAREAIQESTQLIGRNLGLSAALPVLWVERAQLPDAITSHFPRQFPPLRVDRDTVVVGQFRGEPTPGTVTLVGQVAGRDIELSWEVAAEDSHPDLGFLTSVVSRAAGDGGLNLPALGSDGLRAMGLALADNATAMIKSAQFALRSGQPESAKRIAEEALKLDPENPEALNVRSAAQQALDADQSSAIPTGRLMQLGGRAAATSEPPSLLSETLAARDLLAQEQELRRAAAQALQQQVRNQLGETRRLAAQNPTAAKNALKLLLEEVDSAADIDVQVRIQLRDQIGSAIAQTSIQEVKFKERIAQSEAVRAQADFAERVLNETRRDEESLKQLVEHFNFLMTQQRYLEASKDVAPEIEKLVPDSVLAVVTREESSLQANQALVMDAFKRREQGVVDALRGVEEAAIPFDGYPSPVIYPPAEIWQALSARRLERYSAVSISSDDDKAQKIYAALKQPANNITFQNTPLAQILRGLEDEFNIPIWVNATELDTEGIDSSTPVTLELPPVSLRSALRLLLKPLNLTYIIRNEVLEITTETSVENDPVTRIYPVGDLVIPPVNMGGGMGGGMMGGMGGGMMGGMGGGMMGGMGGMGGGMMGGMGGGMGGMGMGGGMFAVPDDSAKRPVTSSAAAHADLDLNHWIATLDAARQADDDQQLERLNARVQAVVHNQVQLAEAHLEAHQVSQAKDEFQRIIHLVGGLLSAGFPQPWMYQALSLSMEACDYPPADIRRVLLSALDFENDSTQAFEIARYMARKNMKAEALQLLRDIAITEPLRYDVYAFAMPLARDLGNLDALRWVCLGMLSKAWPQEHAQLYEEARLLAHATLVQLTQEGRVLEATAFQEELNQAQLRDLIVRVNWTGQADLDLRVQEPTGTVCSVSNPLTLGGGTLIGDSSGISEKPRLDGFSEYYVCAQGFSGQYDILIRRVWGEVSGGKATVEIFTDYGTPEQNYISQVVDLTDKDALIQVSVKNGQRTEPIADAQLAAVRTKQLATSRAVLSQLADANSTTSNGRADYYMFREMLLRNARRNGRGFPLGPGAVGYRPEITTLPEGAMLSVTGVVSPDRRYVRLSPSPFFTGIGEVFTFNFVTGETGTSGAGAGGLGGGAGGVGGGAGGFGGGAGGFGGGGGGIF